MPVFTLRIHDEVLVRQLCRHLYGQQGADHVSAEYCALPFQSDCDF